MLFSASRRAVIHVSLGGGFIPPPKKTHKPTSTITVKEADEKCYSVRADEQPSMSPWVGGFTLTEVLIVTAIATLVILVVLSLSTNVNTIQNLVSQKLQSRADIDQTMQILTSETRSASPSASGAYPLVAAATSSFTFYGDIDRNGTVEQVRYFTSSTSVWKGVTEPTGTPAVYTTSTEIKTDAIDNLVLTTSSPLFTYYDASYTGSSTPIAYPIDVSVIRVVQVSFTTDVNAKVAPGGEYFRAVVAIRNVLGN